jgi:hypothetical protein
MELDLIRFLTNIRGWVTHKDKLQGDLTSLKNLGLRVYRNEQTQLVTQTDDKVVPHASFLSLKNKDGRMNI